MRTQSEYMQIIKDAYLRRIKANEKIFDKYDYSNHTASDLIRDFKDDIICSGTGMKFSNCYHAHGIGNNNEYRIYISGSDEYGFVIEKTIARFYYCYGIFGGCYVSLTDMATGITYTTSHAS